MNAIMPGLGCPECGGTCGSKNIPIMRLSNGLGDVADYDQITVGGQRYSVNTIVDKTLYAGSDVKVYSKTATAPLTWTTPAYVIKKGQAIGKVYSYLKPSADRGGKAALMFYPKSSLDSYYYVLDNDSIDTGTIKEQGGLTVAEEIKKEQEEKLRESDPLGYYIKKYGFPALGIIVGAIVLTSIGKEAIKGAISRKKEEPAKA